MPITYVSGDIFKSKMQTITNAVNCVGVMGKGLALEFRRRFPAMYADYAARCRRKELRIGAPYVWTDGAVSILNFPTKLHWRQPSALGDVERGLAYLAAHYGAMGIASLALPALGCGLGGLPWGAVKALIERHLGALPIEIEVYAPK